MARKIRVQYPGAIYHAMNRGDRREAIFNGDNDRLLFLETLAEACDKTDRQIHAWCLMKNHFHLVVETPRGNLVEGMQWLLGVYTNRFNHRQKEFGHLFNGRYKALHVDGSGNGYLKSVCDYVHLNPVRAGLITPERMRWFLSAYTIRLNHRQKLFGHVFSGRYKALMVEGSGNGYLKTVCDYVHLNPARAHLLGEADRLLAYPWSSLVWYLAAPEHRPGWIRVDRLLGEHGIQQDTAAGRQEFERRMEARRLAETDEEALKIFRRGWCLGGEEFRKEMLEKMEGKL